VRFEQDDAQSYPFEAGAFDVAISRMGAMFFGDLVAAFTNIGRALGPTVRRVLGAAGFTDIELDAANRGMWFGDDADHVYEFVLGLLGWMLEDLDGAGRKRALDALRTTVTAHQTDHGVLYDSAVWVIPARRTS
jgi:Methyltransferase domain